MDKSVGFDKGKVWKNKKVVGNMLGPNRVTTKINYKNQYKEKDKSIPSTRSKSHHVEDLKNNKTANPLVQEIIINNLNRSGKNISNHNVASTELHKYQI